MAGEGFERERFLADLVATFATERIDLVDLERAGGWSAFVQRGTASPDAGGQLRLICDRPGRRPSRLPLTPPSTTRSWPLT